MTSGNLDRRVFLKTAGTLAAAIAAGEQSRGFGARPAPLCGRMSSVSIPTGLRSWRYGPALRS